MDNLHFSTSSILGALTEGILAVIFPIILIVVWKIKTKAKLVPFWVGCLVFPVFIILESIVSVVVSLIDSISINILPNKVVMYLFASLMAGLFEETGRLVGFKTLMRKYRDKRDGITYGIGHGGIESILLVGGSACATLLLAIMVNTGLMTSIFEVYDEDMKELVAGNIRTAAENTFPTYILGFCERISAVILHISLSVIMFTGLRIKGKLWHYPLAIFLHFAADCTVILVHVCDMPIWLFEIIFFAVSAMIGVCTTMYYKKLPQELAAEDTAPISEEGA